VSRTRTTTARLGVVFLLAVTLVAGCTDQDSGGKTAEGQASAGPSVAASLAPAPGGSPSAVPVAASASPSPLPDLGTRAGGGWVYTLNAVRRVSPQAVIVEGTLGTSENSNKQMLEFAEPGYTGGLQGAAATAIKYEFSSVVLSAPGDAKIYQPLRDEQGRCACTQAVKFIDSGAPVGVYTYVTAPADAKTLTVTVQKFAPFPDVPVTG